MRQYSIDQVELAWLGLDFKDGLAQGTSIVEARTAPAFTMKPTANGKVVRVYNPDRSGTVTVTVDQESQLHQSLKTIHKADMNRSTRSQVAGMRLFDASSGEVIDFRNAFIATEPDASRGTESTTFAWIFGFESRDSEPVSPLSNIVGS